MDRLTISHLKNTSEAPWRCCESAQNVDPASAGLRRRPAFAEDLCLIYTAVAQMAVQTTFIETPGDILFEAGQSSSCSSVANGIEPHETGTRKRRIKAGKPFENVSGPYVEYGAVEGPARPYQ
jgi:hypothetical protein